MNPEKDGSKQTARGGILEAGIARNQALRRKYGAHAGLKFNFNSKKRQSLNFKTTLGTDVRPETGKTNLIVSHEKEFETCLSSVAASNTDIGQVQTSLESLEVSEKSKMALTNIQPLKVSNISPISGERECDDLDHIVDQSLKILRTPKLVKARPTPETVLPSSCATGQPLASKDMKAQKLLNTTNTQRPSKICAPQKPLAESKPQFLSKISKLQPRLKDVKCHESKKNDKLHQSLKDFKSLETTKVVKLLPCSEDTESRGSRKDDQLHSRLKDTNSPEPSKNDDLYRRLKDIHPPEPVKDDNPHPRLKDTESREPKADGNPLPRFKAIHSHELTKDGKLNPRLNDIKSHEPTKEGKLNPRLNDIKSHEPTKGDKIPHASMEITFTQPQKDFKSSLMSSADMKLLKPQLSDSIMDSKEQQYPKKSGMHTGMKFNFRSNAKKQPTVMPPFNFQNKQSELQESFSRINEDQQGPKKSGTHTGMKLNFRSNVKKQSTVTQPFNIQSKDLETRERSLGRTEIAPAATSENEK